MTHRNVRYYNEMRTIMNEEELIYFMKRTLSLTLSILLVLSLLAGCSQTPANSGGSAVPDRADADISWQYKTADETKAMLDADEDVIILDTRQDDLYSAGHIPGAYHVPCFPVDTAELEQVLKDAIPNLDGEAPIVVVCKTGNKGAKRAIALMQEEGIAAERLFILEGGGEGWSFPEYTTTENDSTLPGGGTVAPAPTPYDGDRADAAIDWQYITAEDTKAKLDAGEALIVLDSRPDDMYNNGHIPSAYHVPCFPVDSLELENVLRAAVPNLGGDAPIAIVCKTGNKGAKRAISVLVDEGIAPERLYILEGGGEGWSFPEYTTTANDSTVPGSTFTGKYIASPQYIAARIGSEDVVFVDARGEDAAKKGTIQGAIATAWQPLARCADGASGDEMWGTILPLDQLSQALSAMGITPEKEIILFSDGGNGWGDDGRIAWELIAAGFSNVKIAERGFSALEAAGIPTQKGAAAFTPSEVTVTSLDETHLINTDALVAGYDGFKVVDVRADEEYDGQVLYGEKKGGHLPGAIHIRYTDLFDENNVLKPNGEIIAMFEAAGLGKGDQIVTYCTAGIRSAYMQMVLEMCGYENSMNYDESYYRWCAVQDVE